MRYFAIVALLSAPAFAADPLVVDEWWSRDYAKNMCDGAIKEQREDAGIIAQFGCDQVTSCPEFKAISEACVLDERGRVVAFEDALVTSFASNFLCSGVAVYVVTDPKMPKPEVSKVLASPHWSYQTNFKPGSGAQSWQLIHSGTLAYFEGSGDAQSIVQQVCTIVTGKGGQVHQ